MADVKLVGNDDDDFLDAFAGPDTLLLAGMAAVRSGTLKSIRVKGPAYGLSGNTKVGLYADSTGSPGTRLTFGGPVMVDANSWFTIDVENISIVASTFYWLAVLSDGYCGAYLAGDNSIKYKTSSYTSGLPDPAGTGFSSIGGYKLAVAGWGEEAGGGSVVPLLISNYRWRR